MKKRKTGKIYGFYQWLKHYDGWNYSRLLRGRVFLQESSISQRFLTPIDDEPEGKDGLGIWRARAKKIEFFEIHLLPPRLCILYCKKNNFFTLGKFTYISISNYEITMIVLLFQDSTTPEIRWVQIKTLITSEIGMNYGHHLEPSPPLPPCFILIFPRFCEPSPDPSSSASNRSCESRLVW